MVRDIPGALERFREIAERIGERRPFLFLDFDGTITPIVARPELAVIDAAVRDLLGRLARLCPVAVISGRDLADLRGRIGLDGIYYAGCHGFEIEGPNSLSYANDEGLGAIPALEGAESELRSKLAGIGGILFERKRFSLGIHYRLTSDQDVPVIERAVNEALAHHGGLRRKDGKRVFELQPDVAWDKGEAVLWLLRALGHDGPGVMPIFIGDDLTDEDAFCALLDRGIGIVVFDRPRPTAAAYRLHDPGELRRFLGDLARLLESGP
jgi:alpha,alpha-trehalase